MIVYILMVMITFSWLCIFFITPVIQLSNLEFAPAAKAIYHVCSLICHQQEERSYFLLGYQLPVCARCIGIYTGFFIGLAAMPLFRNSLYKVSKMGYLLLFIPFTLDGILQSLHIYQTGNFFRTLTGVMAFVIVPFYIVPVLNQAFSTKNRTHQASE